MQRVAIARAFMTAPPILLADEPTGNLDSTTGAEVLRLLRKQAEDHGTTVVMVTHDANAAQVGTRLIVIRDGRMEQDGPTRRMAQVTASHGGVVTSTSAGNSGHGPVDTAL
jgi:putative ABC transport system ATP-binding protein